MADGGAGHMMLSQHCTHRCICRSAFTSANGCLRKRFSEAHAIIGPMLGDGCSDPDTTFGHGFRSVYVAAVVDTPTGITAYRLFEREGACPSSSSRKDPPGSTPNATR